MKTLTKKLVDLAFEHLAACEVLSATDFRCTADAESTEMLLADPRLRAMYERLRAKDVALLGVRKRDEGNEAATRAAALAVWAAQGAPIVSVSSEFVRELIDAEESADGIDWTFNRASLAIEIDDNVVIAVWKVLDDRTATILPIGSDTMNFNRAELLSLLRKVFHILRHRPEGLLVDETTRKPSLESRQATKRARSSGAKIVAGKHYVIGPDIRYQARIRRLAEEEAVREDRDADAAGRPRRVRWQRRGHFRWQAHGQRWSLRKSIYIAPCWCGREDAPVLVRALKFEKDTRAQDHLARLGGERHG